MLYVNPAKQFALFLYLLIIGLWLQLASLFRHLVDSKFSGTSD